MLFLLVDCSPEESVALYGKEAKKKICMANELERGEKKKLKIFSGI